jgi:hypothetical protein
VVMVSLIQDLAVMVELELVVAALVVLTQVGKLVVVDQVLLLSDIKSDKFRLKQKQLVDL